MRWQYRTILFELQKDGLLGDKYIDDEEINATLNTQGQQGWELVGVTMIQEGLLTFLKRPHSSEKVEAKPFVSSERELVPGHSHLTAEAIQQEEREHIQRLEQQRRQTMQKQERDLFGEIKIS